MEFRVWVGHFSSEARFQQYLSETYTDDRSVPINEFAADQGIVFYDHDWVERHFDRTQGAKGLLTAVLVPAMVPHAAAAASSVGLENANALILELTSEGRITEPRSATGPDYKLHFLGTYTANG
ncbi:MAG: immunity 22 family protein [Actinomycetota bacterium]